MVGGDLLELQEDVPNLSLVGDGGFEPVILLAAQGDGDGFGSHPSGPLITRPTLAGLVSLDQTAQRDPADLGELLAPAPIRGGEGIIHAWEASIDVNRTV